MQTIKESVFYSRRRFPKYQEIPSMLVEMKVMWD